MTVVFIGTLSFVLLVELTCIFFFVKSAPPHVGRTNACSSIQLPFVSILIAARNEVENIGTCLASLEKLGYPKEKLEILLGDDGSNDGTNKIMRDFALGKKHVKLVPILKGYKGLIAKGNVLHQLVEASKGTHLIFLDADMKVSVDWLHGLLNLAGKGYALVSGYTEVAPSGFFAGFQQLEWVKAIFFMKVMADLGKPLTLLGNNMLITRETYEKVGGFEAVGATTVEDFALLRLAMKHRFRVSQLVTGHEKALTEPMKTVGAWLSQRKRWISAIFRLSWGEVIIIVLQRLYIVCCLLLMAVGFGWGLFFLLGKMMLGVIIALLMAKKTGLPIKVIPLFIHEIILGLLNLAVLISYSFSGKQVWKGRKY